MRNKTLIIVLFLVAFIIRFTYSWSFPPLLWDEASLGYNAFSILHTGKDEFGKYFPLIFKSFGDYKPGLYVYLTIPFVAIFGLNELSVRLPSIIVGSLLPIVAYLLLKKIFPTKKLLPIIFALLITTNPWNIHFSRGAWETNILTFELLLGTLLYLNSKKTVSAIIFALSLYTYQGAKILTPAVILSLLIYCRQPIFAKKFFSSFILPLGLLALPLAYNLFFSSGGNRLQVFSIFSYPQSISEVNTIKNESGPVDYSLFHNQTIYFFRQFIGRYFNYFSPRFLLFEGDWQIGRHSAPYIGVLLFPTAVFLVIGIYHSLFSKSLRQFSLLILSWLIFAPIPAALSRDEIQPVRAMFLSLPILYFASIGIDYIFTRFKNIFFIIPVIIIYLFSFYYYLDLYHIHSLKKNPLDWLYGYKQATIFLIDHQNFKNIYFTPYYGQPYIYYLFYSHYDPSQFQRQAILSQTGLDVGTVLKIDNINFTRPDYAKARNEPGSLLILSYDDALKQNINFNVLEPIGPVTHGVANFYAYQNP
jgi:4-amino-4-deoxy-L-arabinose transferase-like glycosyltransferase